MISVQYLHNFTPLILEDYTGIHTKFSLKSATKNHEQSFGKYIALLVI